MSSGRWLGMVAAGLWLVVRIAVPGSGTARRSHAAKPGPRPAVRLGRRATTPPAVLLVGRTRETRAVEARLAAFVRAVQRRDGRQALRFLSRETEPSVRAAVARREWPWRTAPQDLGPLFARPALRLRTVALRPDRARVRVAPQRVDPHSLEAVGYYDIGMVREGAWWQVTLPTVGGARPGRTR